MTEVFEGASADEVWRAAYLALEATGREFDGRGGKIAELMHTVISLKDPRQKWVTVRQPPINPAFAFAELFWIVNGQDESRVINFWNPGLPRYAGSASNYHGAYGKRIRSHFGFDQLMRAYEALSIEPATRQVVIQIHDVTVDSPGSDGKPADPDIPCNICSMLKIRDNKLEWSQVMRSNDLVMGLPYNFIQFTSLQEILAGWLGVELGAYTHFSDSLHWYDRDRFITCLEKSPYPRNRDSLSISKDDFCYISREIYDRMLTIVDRGDLANEKEIRALAKLDSGMTAYDNAVSLLFADVALRREYNNLSCELIGECQNLLYQGLWTDWALKRRSHRIRR